GNPAADSKSSAAKSAARSRAHARALARADAATRAIADSAAGSDAVRWDAQMAERIAIVVGLDIRHVVGRNDRGRHGQLWIRKRVHAWRCKLPRRRFRQLAFAGIQRRSGSAAPAAAGSLLLVLREVRPQI